MVLRFPTIFVFVSVCAQLNCIRAKKNKTSVRLTASRVSRVVLDICVIVIAAAELYFFIEVGLMSSIL